MGAEHFDDSWVLVVRKQIPLVALIVVYLAVSYVGVYVCSWC